MALAQAVADPLAAIPSPSASGACRNVAANGKDSLTLSPGVYCTIAASGTSRLTLEPGLYVVTRGIALSGDSSLRGQGVTLFLTCAGFPAPCGGGSGAGIAMSGHTAVELSGMPSLPAVFFERSNAGSLTMSGSSTAAFDGAVYGRWVAATFSGSASLTAVGGPLVVARLTASGSAQIRVSLHP
jgi:hypothetical protein